MDNNLYGLYDELTRDSTNPELRGILADCLLDMGLVPCEQAVRWMIRERCYAIVPYQSPFFGWSAMYSGSSVTQGVRLLRNFLFDNLPSQKYQFFGSWLKLYSTLLDADIAFFLAYLNHCLANGLHQVTEVTVHGYRRTLHELERNNPLAKNKNTPDLVRADFFSPPGSISGSGC